MGCALKTNSRHCLFSNVRTRGLSQPNRDAKQTKRSLRGRTVKKLIGRLSFMPLRAHSISVRTADYVNNLISMIRD